MDKTEKREKQIYNDLHVKLTTINNHFSHEEFEDAFEKFESLRQEIEDKVGRFDANEVAEVLLGVEYLDEETSYRDVAMKAKELGIQYVGVKQKDLLEKVNKEIRRRAIPDVI